MQPERAAMNDEDKYKIPAASIGDTDLGAVARTDPGAAKEIARLEDLMGRGEETKEEFLRLCQLLFDVGSVPAAEILLRRNLEYYEGETLYAQLFGKEKPTEFEAAIEAFSSQFGVALSLAEKHEFLVSTFHSDAGLPRDDDFRLLSKCCEIKFGYIEQDTIEADVILRDPVREDFDADEYLLMHFVNGVWEIAMDA